MIIVTGATGQLGRGVIANLLDRTGAGRVVASVRDPAKAVDLAAQGVHVRTGDFAKPDELASAFEGATAVLVTSVDKLGEEAVQMHRVAIEAACAAGARRVFYTSHMGARADSPFAPAGDHAATEAILASTGVPFTALRHGFYTESCLHMIGKGLAAGEIRAPEDGPVSWTARADLAQADAVLLTTENDIDGATPPLTAGLAVTLDEVAMLASEVLGRPIKRVVLPDQEWVDEKVVQGVPAPMARLLLGTFVAARRGDFTGTDPLLETLLGRPPLTMHDVLARVQHQ